MKKLCVAALAITMLAGGLVMASSAFAWQEDSAEVAMEDSEESFVAVLRGQGNIAVGRSTRIEIYIDRWSTPEERNMLLGTLAEGGPQALVNALQRIEPVGRIRVGTRTSYPLSYSRQIVNEDGSRTIRLVTDRPISSLEALNASITMDHAFSLFELNVDADNKGDGTVIAGARIKLDMEAGTMGIESYDSAPLRLGSIRPGR